ncbi:Gata transcription factor [Mycena kentingensis (nom. inval.)]|nr:Gata transcription factor [Mycena kentingensis (nom. inval.)]
MALSSPAVSPAPQEQQQQEQQPAHLHPHSVWGTHAHSPYPPYPAFPSTPPARTSARYYTPPAGPLPISTPAPPPAGARPGEIVYTSDSATRLSDRIRRRCFNCETPEAATWRKSVLVPGKVLCNKCGLYERTHQRPRPPMQDLQRSGGRPASTTGKGRKSKKQQGEGHVVGGAGGHGEAAPQYMPYPLPVAPPPPPADAAYDLPGPGRHAHYAPPPFPPPPPPPISPHSSGTVSGTPPPVYDAPLEQEQDLVLERSSLGLLGEKAGAGDGDGDGVGHGNGRKPVRAWAD